MANNYTASDLKKDVKDAARETADDVKHAAADMANAAKDKGAEYVEAAKEKGAEYAERAREEADRLYRAGERKATDVAQYAGDYYDEMSDMVRRKPAQALGIAAGVGFLVGLILARR